MSSKKLSKVEQQLKEERLAEAKRKRENLQLLTFRTQTSIDQIRSYVPPPKNPLPCNGLPEWCDMRLDQKFPAVPAPNGTFITSVGDLAENIFIKTKTDFDLSDPLILNTPIVYDPLHDPNLKDYFQMNPLVCKRLIDLGLLNCQGKVICSLPEFNKYRQYLSRIHNNEIKKEQERIQAWERQEHETIKTLVRYLERTVKHKIEEERKNRMEANRQEIEEENRERKQRALKHPSNFIKERRILEARIRKVKREAIRCTVLDRVRRMRDAERRRARHLVLEFICRDEFRQKLRKVDQIEKRINRQEDLCEFIESKRYYQEQKRRQRFALLKRDKIEKACLIKKRFDIYSDKFEHDRQKQLRAQQRDKDKAARKHYLMYKYGHRWLELTRKYNGNPLHQSTWNIRNILHSMVQYVKHEADVKDFTTFINDILKLKNKQIDPETKDAVDHILQSLLDNAFRLYMKRLTSCLVDFVVDQTRKEVENCCDDTYLEPSDFDSPKMPKRRREKITLPKPSYPCTGPCAQFGRAHDPHWPNNCVQELEWLRSELCLRLTSKLVDQIHRGKGSCLARLEDRARNAKCPLVCNAVCNLTCVTVRRARKRKYTCKDRKYLDKACNDIVQAVAKPPTPKKKTPLRKRKSPQKPLQNSIPTRPRQITDSSGGQSSAYTTDSEADAIPISPGVDTGSGPENQQRGTPVKPTPVKGKATGGTSRVGTGTQFKPPQKAAATGDTTPRTNQATDGPPKLAVGASTETLRPIGAAVQGAPPKDVKEKSTEPKIGRTPTSTATQQVPKADKATAQPQPKDSGTAPAPPPKTDTATEQEPPADKGVDPTPPPLADSSASPVPAPVESKDVQTSPPVKDKETVNEPKPTKQTGTVKKRKSEIPTGTEPPKDQGVGKTKPSVTDAETDREPPPEISTESTPPPTENKDTEPEKPTNTETQATPSSTEQGTDKEPLQDKETSDRPDTKEDGTEPQPKQDKDVIKKPETEEKITTAEPPKEDKQVTQTPSTEEKETTPPPEGPSKSTTTQEKLKKESSSEPSPPAETATKQVQPEEPVNAETQENVPLEEKETGEPTPVEAATEPVPVPATDKAISEEPKIDLESQNEVPQEESSVGPDAGTDSGTEPLPITTTDEGISEEPKSEAGTQEEVPQTEQETGPTPPLDSTTETPPTSLEDKETTREPKAEVQTQDTVPQEETQVGPEPQVDAETESSLPPGEDKEVNREPPIERETQETVPQTDKEAGPPTPIESETEPVPVPVEDKSVSDEPKTDAATERKPSQEESGVGPPETVEGVTETEPSAETVEQETSQEPTAEAGIDTEPRDIVEKTTGLEELANEETEIIPGQDVTTEKEPEPGDNEETQKVVDTQDVCIDPETGEDICVGGKVEPESEEAGVGPPSAIQDETQTSTICDEDRVCGPDPWDNEEIESGNLTRAVSSSVNTILRQMQKCLIEKCMQGSRNQPCRGDTSTDPCLSRRISTQIDCILAGFNDCRDCDDPTFLNQTHDPRERCMELLAGQMREFCLDLSPEELNTPEPPLKPPSSSAKAGMGKPQKTVLSRVIREACLPPRDSDSDLSRTASEFVRQIVQQERTRLMQDCVDGSGDDYKAVGTTVSEGKVSHTSSEMVQSTLLSAATEATTLCIEAPVGSASVEADCQSSSVVSQCVHQKLEHIKKMLADIKSDLASIGIRTCRCVPESDSCKPP